MTVHQFLLHPLAPHLGQRYSFALVPRLTDFFLNHVLVRSFSFYFFLVLGLFGASFFLQPSILNSFAFFILSSFFLFGSTPLRYTRLGARKIQLQRPMKYFPVITIIFLEYILKFRTTFHWIRIQVIIPCIRTKKNFNPSLPI